MTGIITALIAFIAGLTFNYFGKHWERQDRNRVEKAERYSKLLQCVVGFTEGLDKTDSNRARELKSEFLQEVNLIWLYCPDNVIRKTYAFLDTVHEGKAKPATDKEKETALAEFVLALRKDMLDYEFPKATSLRPCDFKLLASYDSDTRDAE